MIEDISVNIGKKCVSRIGIAFAQNTYKLVKIIVNSKNADKIPLGIIDYLAESRAVKTCLFVKIRCRNIEIIFRNEGVNIPLAFFNVPIAVRLPSVIHQYSMLPIGIAKISNGNIIVF